MFSNVSMVGTSFLSLIVNLSSGGNRTKFYLSSLQYSQTGNVYKSVIKWYFTLVIYAENQCTHKHHLNTTILRVIKIIWYFYMVI